MKRTKIVCTLGPASEDPATIEALVKAGCNVVRLNMSHGDYDWHECAIKNVRAAAKKTGEPVAIVLDLQGPKVRLGEVHNSQFTIHSGDRVVFTTSKVVIPRSHKATRNPVGKSMGSFTAFRMTSSKIPIAMPNFHKYVRRGSHLLIADGTIECVVERVVGHDIQTKIILGGELKSHKGIAIAGVSLPLPSLTAKDKRDVQWARVQDIDFVALSFVKRVEDVRALRKKLSFGPRRNTKAKLWMPAIIVKIETREAVRNFNEILCEADGVMIARGDLALATSPEEVPIIQKEIIEKCRQSSVPVIVATEMLASMEHSPRPTRAEASDVANAVIDHTDAVMLSGESATGQYPVETVATMAHIIKKTEQSRFDNLPIDPRLSLGDKRFSFGQGETEIALAASVLARTKGAAAIVASSLTGHIGRLLSSYRSEIFLFIGSPIPHVVRELNLSWGVRPFYVPKAKTMDALLKYLLAHARQSGLKKGSKAVFVGSKKLAPHASDLLGTQIL
ncbi:MAG: Pyruvate kinase [Candidatus Magasanikbacteria bacterium GW2011_GWA2_50_22]|uniref:Pyruvate kinase n=1 Tax=Candidatus Magasanikbacteria bacterium GW2011_GWA2_50_22 TaxID=1619043 RepID=A0A0G1WF07_9BACT|nr:MAG: Pyruvate kinase [Candidatus Magasanikbacteria bacterium GW2011_GWA2_50_22]